MLRPRNKFLTIVQCNSSHLFLFYWDLAPLNLMGLKEIAPLKAETLKNLTVEKETDNVRKLRKQVS